MRWTPEQYLAHSVKKPKYKNTKVEHNGIKFDSMKERDRYCQLKLLERAGKIGDVKHQVKFVLAPSVKFSDSERAKPELRLIVDFTYIENGALVVEDCKSDATMTTAFTIKRHILLANFGLQIRIYN